MRMNMDRSHRILTHEHTTLLIYLSPWASNTSIVLRSMLFGREGRNNSLAPTSVPYRTDHMALSFGEEGVAPFRYGTGIKS